MGFVGSSLLAFLQQLPELLIKNIRKLDSLKALIYVIIFFGVIGMAQFGRMIFHSLRIYLSYRDISKDVQRIGECLLATLIHANIIKEMGELKVIANVNKNGTIFCRLDGGTKFDQSTFIKALEETIKLVDNPRFLIIRKNRWIKLITQKDYHSVPSSIGKRKENAQFLANKWNILVGDMELVNTRTYEGRKTLVKARMQSLAAQLSHTSDRVTVWK